MNDPIPIPDTWRDELAAYPSEVVFATIAVTTFLLLVLLAKRPRLVLRGVIGALVLAAGIAAGVVGTRAGALAERGETQRTAILGGVVLLLLVFGLRLRSSGAKTVAHRKLVRDVHDDPQKLLVLALAPEISENARRLAVKLLEDPFTLDRIARRSRSNGVRKLAKRRLARVRTQARDTAGDATRQETPDTADGRDGSEEILPEAFYLPPEER